MLGHVRDNVYIKSITFFDGNTQKKSRAEPVE